MIKRIVVVLIVLAIASGSVSSVLSQEVKKSPSTVTGICLFEGGTVYCPELGTTPIPVSRQEWEVTQNAEVSLILQKAQNVFWSWWE